MMRTALCAAILAMMMSPAAQAQVDIEGIDNPQGWTSSWLDRFEEEGSAVLVELMMAYGSDFVSATNAVSGLSPMIDGQRMRDAHFMSDTRYGVGVRQIVLATYWDSGAPIFVRFLFMRVEDSWHAIQFDINTQLADLNVYQGPGDAQRMPRR